MNIETTDIEDDEFSEEQIAMSTDMAYSFVDEEIIPILEQFDYDNEDEDYVPGVAAFAMYTRIVDVLISEGYSADDLKSVVDDFAAMQHNGLLH